MKAMRLFSPNLKPMRASRMVSPVLCSFIHPPTPVRSADASLVVSSKVTKTLSMLRTWLL